MNSRVLPVAFLCLLVACKNDAPAPNPAASAAPTSSAIPDDFVVNGFFAGNSKLSVKFDGGVDFGEGVGEEPKGPGTKILDKGADPHALLAYNLTLNKTTTLNAAMQTEFTGPDIPPQAQGKQEIKFSIAVTPKKKLEGAKTQIEIKVVKLDMGTMPPEMQKQVAQLEAELQKVSATFSLTPNGQVGDMQLPPPDRMPKGVGELVTTLLNRSLDMLFVPFPTEPLGVGAKWQVATTVGEEGAVASSTYTLVSKNDKQYEVKLDTNLLLAGRTGKDPRSGKTVIVEDKINGNYSMTTTLDAPALKASGNTATEESQTAQGEPRKTRTQKTSITLERPAEAPPKK